jgi:hypothetical protein
MTIRATRLAYGIAALLSGGLFTAGPALAGPCDIANINPASPITAPQGGGFYDVFSTDPQNVQFRVTIENDTPDDQQCRVIFELASGGTELQQGGGTDTLDFDLRSNNGNNSFLVPAGDRPPGRNFNVDANSQRGRNYRFFIDEEQFVAPGTYERTVTVSTFIRNRRGNILDQATVVFRTEVEPQGALFISVLGAPDPQATAQFKTAFLDFGNITKTNNTGEVRFLIQSNSGFDLEVSSQNDGEMRLFGIGGLNAVNGFSDAISYTVNGESLSTTPVPFFDQQNGTSQEGARQTFTIELDTGPDTRSDIEVPEGKLAGRYLDTLTFTIVPE